jgi:hypothetical protein
MSNEVEENKSQPGEDYGASQEEYPGDQMDEHYDGEGYGRIDDKVEDLDSELTFMERRIKQLEQDVPDFKQELEYNFDEKLEEMNRTLSEKIRNMGVKTEEHLKMTISSTETKGPAETKGPTIPMRPTETKMFGQGIKFKKSVRFEEGSKDSKDPNNSKVNLIGKNTKKNIKSEVDEEQNPSKRLKRKKYQTKINNLEKIYRIRFKNIICGKCDKRLELDKIYIVNCCTKLTCCSTCIEGYSQSKEIFCKVCPGICQCYECSKCKKITYS